MIVSALKRAMVRLDVATPDFKVSSSRAELARRARSWAWPAVQMGVASALAWMLATRAVPSAASYAPITAIGALGLGRERRLARSGLIFAGLFFGVVAAEIAASFIGQGWWQIGVILAATAIVAGAVLDRDLAVTYAVINAVVLVTIPGNEGWMPDRLVAGLIGVAAAIAVTLLIMPPRPVALVTRRLERAVRSSIDALDLTVDVISGDADHRHDDGDARPLIAAARRVDDEIERSHDSVAQAIEIVHWSPLRRRDRAEIRRLEHVAHQLRPALRTASTIARLADRAAANEIAAADHVLDGLRAASTALPPLVAALIHDDHPPAGDDERAAEAADHILSSTASYAIMIALQEEVRGLLADIAAIVDGRFDGAVTSARERSAGGTIDGIAFGTHAVDS